MKTLVLFLIATLSAAAQTADKGKQVVQDAVEAMGGPKFLSMKNRIEAGRAFSFYREQVTGLTMATIYTEYLDHIPPHGLGIRERQAFGKKQDYSILFLEDQGFEINYRGARPVPDDRWKRYLKTACANIFYLMREIERSEAILRFCALGRGIEHAGEHRRYSRRQRQSDSRVF